MGKTLCALVCLLPFSFSLASGDIVLASVTGSTNAQLAALSDSDNLEQDTGTIQSLVSQNNSYTQSDANWEWDGSTLSGSGLVSEIKTQNAKKGGNHIANSTLDFQFTIDTAINYSIDGFWGFQNVQPGGESLTISLSDGSGVIASDSSASTAGISSDAFTLAGVLGPGTYTMSIDVTMAETINNSNAPPGSPAGSEALGGWQLTGFTLSTTAVPEPASLSFVFGLGMAVAIRRRR